MSLTVVDSEAASRWNRIFKLILGLTFGLGFLGFGFLAFHVFVADSEFWSISLGYHFFEDFKYEWVYTRPLYYFLLWLSQLEYISPSQSIWMARGLFGLIATGLFMALYKVQKIRDSSGFVSIFTLVLLIGNTGFLNQGFRVRSDLLASALAMLALYRITRCGKVANSTPWFWLSLPLLATPKAILQVLALGPFYIRLADLKKYTKTIVIFMGIGGTIFWYFNKGNITYLMHAFSGEWGGPAYFSRVAFFHVENQVTRNPFFWGLFVVRVWTFIFSQKIRRKTSASEWDFENKYFLMTSMMLALVLVSVEKVQFLIAAFLPFFAMHAAMILGDLAVLKNSIFIRGILVSVGSVWCLLGGGHWLMTNYEKNNNHEQAQSLDALYSFLNTREISSVADFTCLLAPLCQERHFLGPYQPKSNKDAFVIFRKTKPEVFLYLKKAKMLEPKLSEYLIWHYKPLGKGVYYRIDKPSDQLKVDQSKAVISQNETSRPSQSLEDRLLGVTKRLARDLEPLFGYDIDY